MSHIHYKFSSKLSYNTVVFDDVNITLSELKRLIMSREKLRAADCDLQITNAQTKEEYTDDDSPIPKGSSVIVRRIPSRGGKSISKSINSQRAEAFTSSYGFFRSPMDGQKSTGVLPIFSKMANIASSDCSEDDKIKTMMSQSFYDSANYKCGTPLPANYTCYRCGSSEHHIRNCPVTLDRNAEPGVKIKKSTGIPRSFMVKVDDPSIKGAMLTNTGDYAVPAIDAEVYAACKKKTVVPESQIEEPPDAPIPDELMCLICKDLLNDAVVIPCCGNSYCDDCIRSALLDSEDHVCPTCNQSDVSPDALIANKFLRQAVNNFTKEQISIQSLKNTCSTSRSQDSSLRPSPAPTPPLPSQPDKSQVELMVADKPTDSPPCSASPSLIVVKISDDIPDKEVDLKTDRSPEESPSVFVSESVSEADTCDSVSQSIPLVSSVTQAVTDESQSDQAPLWDGSASASPSEGWTAISTVPTHSTSTSFSPNVTPHIQMYLSLQQQLHNPYSPAFTTTTPSWTSGPSPQGAPVPTFTSAASIPPLLPKDLMLYHRRNKERTPPRGSSYQSYLYSSKSLRSKSSRSSSRSPSQSRSHHRSRPYSPHSSHRGTSSHSSHSYSHSNKRSHSPIPTSSPRSHSQRRSRSPADHFKSRHHTSRSSPSSHNSSRRRESSHRPREAPDWNLDEYLRRKQEYKDWCEKYFNSYFSHFHQMPPPPLMPPPQPHWPTSYPHKGPSPPSSDSLTSQSHSASSTSNSHSASSYSDNHSTPTLSFSDSNSPLSDDCARASQEPLKVSRHRDKDEDQNKRESGKQNTEDYTPLKSPLKKLDKHLKSKGEHKKKRDQKLSDKEKERRSEGKEDGSRESGRSRSSDSRSDKSRKRKKHEDYQRKNILIEQSPRCDPPPKVFEREKPKKSAWKPQPLTKENAWEGSMTVKMPQKININIHLDAKKTESDVEEAKKMVEEVEGHTSVNPFCNQSDKAIKHENDVEGQLIPDEGVRDEKNDSWEICPEDEVVGDDSDLWHCALTTLEEEELKQGKETEVKRVTEEDGKPQIREDITDSERKRDETPSTTKDCGSWTVGPSGDLTGEKTVVKCLEKHMDKSLLEKHRERVKVTHSGWDKDGCEKELQSKVSSNYREVKNRTKMRSVKESAEEMANSTSTYGTVVPSGGQHVTDNSFDLDGKQKKRTERVSECRKGEERSHRKERESISTFFSTSNKMSTGSSHSFKSILDENISIKFKESSENRDTEGSSQNIYTDLEMGKGNKSCSYSRSHYHHNSRQDPNVHHKWSTPHSDCRDGGRQTPKTSTKGWTSPSPVPPCAQSSLGMALTTSNTEGKNNNERMDKLERLNDGQMYSERSSCSTNENDDAKNERRSKKKHKREKRLTSSDEGKKKKKNKD